MLNYARAGALVLGMKLNQWKSASELEELQSARLARLLSHARLRCPYYRRLPDARDGLSSLPFLTKADLRREGASLVDSSLDKSKLMRLHTSGSTGTPIAAYYDISDGIYGSALRYHHLTEGGFGPRHRLVDLLHSHEPRSLVQRLGLFRFEYLSVLDDEEKNLAALRRIAPDMLLAFPSALALLSSLNIRQGRPVRLKKIFSQSEFLPEQTRKLASEAFGCPVRNAYAANEMRTIAWECDKGSMHVNSDSVIVEIVDGEGNPVPRGQSGNVVLTPLWRRSMPLIRYWIGDRGALGGKCTCGRGLHVLKSLEGRSNDFIVLPSGRRYPGSCAGAELKWFGFILQYQIVQERDGSLLVRVVSEIPLTEAKRREIAQKLLFALQEEVPVEVRQVERLERTGAGKLRCVISRFSSAPEANS